VTQLLYRRYKNNLNGFIFLPCELIDKNGAELKKCVLKYAQLWGLETEFIQWIEEENYFANTLVDKIVTGFPTDQTASLHPEDKYIDTAELFHLWVIEGDFENELPLKKCGFNVIWTDDAAPYKKIKVRILNGAHTSLVAGALLSGIETVGEAMADEVAYSFLCKVMNEEILPTIGANEESNDFADSVFDRFKNPYIHHRWEAISLNSISKFSVRVLPTILEYKEKFGEFPDCLSLSIAYLIYYYKNKNPQDSQEAIDYIKENSIANILKNEKLWQRDISALTEKIEGYYGKIEEIGPKEAMKWIL
jgi:tagaturonate reductase